MIFKGVLLSCLMHVMLIWFFWDLDWFRGVTHSPDYTAAPVLVAIYQLKAAPVQAPPPPVQAPPSTRSAAVAVAADQPEPNVRQDRVVQEKSRVPAESTPSRRPARVSQVEKDVTASVDQTASLAAVASPPSAASAMPALSPAPPVNNTASKPLQPSYAQRLTQRIEQHKTYPRRARARGLSDEVLFSVSINDTGEMQAFHWLEGHTAFRASTLQAVRRALPYPPDPGQAPVSVQIRMIYSLQDRI
ncbi:TonB family C-terminal domain-containing protein [Allopseudospirillum japonicum]|uniref:TonB family C-terminal domain-containing protein n=1 Tax=Allopseudospirillum japonicum TaxID=64971 RepID=A0A1H6S8D2_9GAMM|nr:TonB family protein [Allopseudospirillum japonicum]SEI61027.1 TonB family C-terminal domain-containing protein [Allopseudospirillum japonicum]